MDAIKTYSQSETVADKGRTSSDKTVYPEPVIKERKRNSSIYSSLLEKGVSQWIADILSRRIDAEVDCDAIFSPTINNIEDPILIPNMESAVERIVTAITNKERIILTVDHDLDGTASGAVLWKALVDYFFVNPDNIDMVTSHRLSEGYGITAPVADRIINKGASLVISADKGSSDEPRIKVIADAGIDVIITDHHAIPVEGPPKSAYAVVNPTIPGSLYDPNICGAAVAFLTMAKVRSCLLRKKIFKAIPTLSTLLDYVAVATIADCVALRPDKSYANRAFVKYGLSMLNKAERPCWNVFKQGIEGPVLSETIAFQLAPPIAAAGRLDWAEAGFRFLIADTYEDALKQWRILQSENNQRKIIEQELRQRAFKEASKIEGVSIVLYFDDGHSGVHGITASRLVEKFGKPAAIFAPKGSGLRNIDQNQEGLANLASGSFRSIAGVHIRDALQYVDDKHPGLLVGFGGHAGAAGATITVDSIDVFSVAFEEAILLQLGDLKLDPEIIVDGKLPTEKINVKTGDELINIEPWGKDFPYPAFSGSFKIKSVRIIGKTKEHLKLTLLTEGGSIFDAVWFNSVKEEVIPVTEGQFVFFIYRLVDNWYRGMRKVQLNITSIDSRHAV